jgi:hypothetical protein
MANKTYSFLDVSATLVGPGGFVQLGSGAGNSEEGIEIETSEDINTMTVGADGSGMHSLSANKSGRITVRLLKTSPTNAKLMAMVNVQRTSGATHGQNTLTIRDTNLGDVAVGQQVAFKKIPNNSWAKNAGMLEWIFDAVTIDQKLGA